MAFCLLCRHGQSRSPPAGGEIPYETKPPAKRRTESWSRPASLTLLGNSPSRTLRRNRPRFPPAIRQTRLLQEPEHKIKWRGPPAGGSPLYFHFIAKLFDIGVELLTGAFFPLQPASAGTGVVAIPQDEQARLGDPFDLKSSGGMNPPISALRAAANAAVALRNASLRLGVRQD